MKPVLHSLLVNPMFIITSISVLLVITYMNAGLGFIIAFAIALVAVWSDYSHPFHTSWKIDDHGVYLWDILYITLGAIGVSVLIGLSFVSLRLSGLINSSIDGLPVLDLPWFYQVFLAFVGGFCLELILRGYLLRNLAGIFGDNQSGWIVASLIISILYGVALSSFGMLTMLTAITVSLHFSITYGKRKDELVKVLIAHAFYGIWFTYQAYLFQDRLFQDVYIVR